MIIKGSILNVIDNSTPVLVKCIYIYNKKHIGSLGDVILVVVKKTVKLSKFNKKSKNNFIKSSVCKGIIVQLKRKIQRKDGLSLRFDSNCCIILTKQLVMAGTRIWNPVAFELDFVVIAKKFIVLAPLIV